MTTTKPQSTLPATRKVKRAVAKVLQAVDLAVQAGEQARKARDELLALVKPATSEGASDVK